MKNLHIAGIAVVAVSVVGTCVAAIPEGVAESIYSYEELVTMALGLLMSAGLAIYVIRELGKKMGWF